MSHIEIPSSVFWSNQGQNDHVHIYASHEDRDNFAVLVSFRLTLRREGESFANSGLNRRGRGRGKVPQLIRGTDDKGPEGSGRKLHQVDRNHTPGPLDAELFKKGSRNDPFVGSEAIGVEENTTDNAHDDDRKSATKDLRR